jgi:hypothetical protein
MEKVKAVWATAASWATKGWTWVNLYTNGPLLALVLLVVLVSLSQCANAQGGFQQFPVLINMDRDIWPVYTPNPKVIIYCEENESVDRVHLCQPFGMPVPGNIVPVGGAVYCFVAESREVIREGEPATQRRWGCGMDRTRVADEARKVGKEVEVWGRPIRAHETPVSIEI